MLMEGEHPPPPAVSQSEIAEEDTDAPHQPPSPDPCLRGVCQPCGGVKDSGASQLLKSPSAGFTGTSLRGRSPGGLDVLLPGPTPLSPHRGPRGPGQGEGVPGGEASVHLQGPFTWWHGICPGASTWAGTGPDGSARGHPTTAEQTGPLSLSQGGRSRVPTDGHPNQSQVRNGLA